MRDRRLLSGAVGLSALGDFLGFIPLALYLQERTGSGIAVAGLFIALWAPSVILGGHAGLLADRIEGRRLLRDVSLAQAAVALVLAFAFGGLAATLALTALLGVGVAVAQPAEFALVPAVAGRGGVAAANGRIEAARYLGFTLGPVLGGLLAAAGGTRIALLVNAASFLAVAVVAQALRARREPSGARPLVGARPRRPHLPPGRRRPGARRDRRLRLAAVHDRVRHRRGVLRQGRPTRRRHRLRRADDALDAGHGDRVDARRHPGAGRAVRHRGAGGDGAAGCRPCAARAVAGASARARRLPRRRDRARHEERRRPHAHPHRVPDELRGRAWAAYSAGRNAAELVALVGGGLLVAAIGARWTLLAAGALPIVAAAVALARAQAARRRAGVPARRTSPSSPHDDDAVAPAALGLVQGGVGGAEERADRPTSSPWAAATPIDAVTCRPPGRVSSKASRARSATSLPSASVRPGRTTQELLAAEAVDQLERAQLLAQQQGGVPEDVVAAVVAVLVVDRLEAVEVAHDHADRVAGQRRLLGDLGEARRQRRAVEQSGQGIEGRLRALLHLGVHEELGERGQAHRGGHADEGEGRVVGEPGGVGAGGGGEQHGDREGETRRTRRGSRSARAA